jgi:hypothetical protein
MAVTCRSQYRQWSDQKTWGLPVERDSPDCKLLLQALRFDRMATSALMAALAVEIC